MFMSNVRATVLASAVLAALGLPAQASHAGDCGAPCDSPCGPVAPAFRTITVTEWVPETYKTMATAYRTEFVNEAYTAYRTENVTEKFTAYRTECVPEARTRQFTVSRYVPETSAVTVSVWKCVPSIEKRTVCRTVVSYQPVTTVTRKCVDQGHWECREVPVQTMHSRMKKHFHKKNDCCEPVCVPTKTVKVWVPNKVWIEVPVTYNKAVCTTVNETIDVTVSRMVESKEVRQVTTHKCVPEVRTETYTVQVPRQVAYEASRVVCRTVPYQATRQVGRSVPYQTEVTATRMVARTVERQVAVESCEGVTVSSSGFGGHRLFGKSGGKKGHGHKKAACCD
jgi:hypothetical protein